MQRQQLFIELDADLAEAVDDLRDDDPSLAHEDVIRALVRDWLTENGCLRQRGPRPLLRLIKG